MTFPLRTSRFLFLSAALMALPYNASARCAMQVEAEALSVRALKSSLMVAALSCGQQEQYNGFVRTHRAALHSGGKEIRGYFARVYGTTAEGQLNRFITRLANQASQSSMQENPEHYCTHTVQLFGKLKQLDKAKLTAFAEQEKYASLHNIRACTQVAGTPSG